MTVREFHISRAARTKYRVDAALFSLRGTLVLANFYATRQLAQSINTARDAARHPEAAVQAGELNALGLIHEIFHYILEEYRRQRSGVMAQAVAVLRDRLGAPALETTLRRFVDEFPPLSVYRGEETIEAYLNGSRGGVPNRETLLEEVLLVWLQNENPAAAPFKELFDDSRLARDTAYPLVIETLREFFAAQEPIGPERRSLIEILRAPLVYAPLSLSAQLEFILYRWSAVAGVFDLTPFRARVLGGLQLIREEERFLWAQQARGFGGFTATTPPVPVFTRERVRRVDAVTGKEEWFELEPEQFSPDVDWMPSLVLIAKSTYVWLDQLSKKYGSAITQLDQIPDAELDELAQRGITGLWLIGVWERSPASARIKHLLGNPDAMASAYSLYDYEIATELGGAPALERLKGRAAARGIRLASDMVPNHMGIDSRWVVEHPEWFIQCAVPPYPTYTYSGPDLSSDRRICIQIEDHYWDRSDAAVVFKRTERASGEARYIYHGNDGTSFPWNDTAQLNYLLPEVREQVIQTILRVARQFPVIRFDAAMTLAKKHYQRLWFPLPGETETIPSRAEYTMTKAAFDQAMPEEFWREVVDRVAQEAPDTLLLAEAFWLMEGYFVRTLGMHRVYNSAFMHMLRDEKNQEYRLVIKNTIEFDPEVLRRYVNFMNNPDERTAVDQFGKGDKYFGVCTLMATLPGLPMFGHGQIEGFAERYGMEFRRAMLDETPDAELVARHAREIFPLLHRRQLFAGVENFLLFDLFRPDGRVNENVIAFTNRWRGERALVAYNNSFTAARGTLRVSAAFRDKTRDALVQRTLVQGLQLSDPEHTFLVFRDHVSGLEFIRRSRDLAQRGLELELGGYGRVVYLDFREVADAPGQPYALLHDRLHGRGVPSIENALREIHLEPLHNAFRALFDADTLRAVRKKGKAPKLPLRARSFARVASDFGAASGRSIPTRFAKQLRSEVTATAQVAQLAARIKRPRGVLRAALDHLRTWLSDDSLRDGLTAFAYARALGALAGDGAGALQAAAWLDEWQLGDLIAAALRGAGTDELQARQLVRLVQIGLEHERWEEGKTPAAVLDALLSDPGVARFLNVNRFDNVLWYNKEAFEMLLPWLQVLGALQIVREVESPRKQRAALVRQSAILQALRSAGEQSGYRVEHLISALAAAAEAAPAGRIGELKKKAPARRKAARPARHAARPVRRPATRRLRSASSARSKLRERKTKK